MLPSRLAEARQPFDPLAPGMLHRSADGEAVLIWLFACRGLGPDGRCGIYASRPATMILAGYSGLQPGGECEPDVRRA